MSSYHQRQSPILAELCTFLVQHKHGELAARVHSVLARHGRQTLAAVARACYLNAAQIKDGLVILIRQHLVFQSSNDSLAAYYEINWHNSYALVRLNRVPRLVQARFGKKAAGLVSTLLNTGQKRIAELKDAYSLTEPDSDDQAEDDIVNGINVKRRRINGPQASGTAYQPSNLPNGNSPDPDSSKQGGAALVNGHGKIDCAPQPPSLNSTTRKTTIQKHSVERDYADISSEKELLDTVQRLIEHGWVMTVKETQYLSPGDMHDLLQQEAIEQVNKGIVPTGTKDKDMVHRATLASKRKTRDDWLAVPEFTSNRKRKGSFSGNSTKNSNKRVKLNGASNWTASQASISDNDLIICINPEKIAVALRTDQLVELVKQRLGDTTALVYQTMLRMLEKSIPRCFEEWPDPPVPSDDSASKLGLDPRLIITARDVAHNLSQDITIIDGLEPNTIVKVTRKGHVRSQNILSQPVDPSSLTPDEKIMFVEKHIQLLSDDPFHFVSWYSRSQWHVEFEEIAKQMIQTEVENTITAKQGPLGVQLIRALRKRGKLDERAICNALKKPANDIRGTINDLTVQGYVQTQEIPKVDRREAKHSIHLVWYDRQRAREKLLHDTYKGMARTIQRMAYEREKVQPVLSKAERSDVVGNEEKWLSKGELRALKLWQEVHQKLLLQLYREDELVATLRDFYGPLISV